MYVRKGNDAKKRAIPRFFLKIPIECGIAFLEILLFLENHSLELLKKTSNWNTEKKMKFNQGNLFSALLTDMMLRRLETQI